MAGLHPVQLLLALQGDVGIPGLCTPGFLRAGKLCGLWKGRGEPGGLSSCSQLWGGGRKAALSSFVSHLVHLFISLAPYLDEKTRGGLEGLSLMFSLRKSTAFSSTALPGGPDEPLSPPSCCSEPCSVSVPWAVEDPCPCPPSDTNDCEIAQLVHGEWSLLLIRAGIKAPGVNPLCY